MIRYYEPDPTVDPNRPFVRDGSNKLVRRGYWMDMNDRTLVMIMTNGIGANLTNDEKRVHLTDLKRGHLMQVCGSDEQANAFIRWRQIVACDMVKAHRLRIQLVAGQLIERENLSQTDLDAIIVPRGRVS